MTDNKAAIHMVSAYASSQRICLSQQVTYEKSNELTAIPELLDLVLLEGCAVTIDAMGCQQKISQAILDKKAHYILGVKENKKGLLEQIKKVFVITRPTSVHTTDDMGHGRIERRVCSVIGSLEFFDDYKAWPENTCKYPGHKNR